MSLNYSHLDKYLESVMSAVRRIERFLGQRMIGLRTTVHADDDAESHW